MGPATTTCHHAPTSGRGARGAANISAARDVLHVFPARSPSSSSVVRYQMVNRLIKVSGCRQVTMHDYKCAACERSFPRLRLRQPNPAAVCLSKPAWNRSISTIRRTVDHLRTMAFERPGLHRAVGRANWSASLAASDDPLEPIKAELLGRLREPLCGWAALWSYRIWRIQFAARP